MFATGFQSLCNCFGIATKIVLSRFISLFIIKQITNITNPAIMGSIPPNVNIIPITNPNKHSGKCIGLKKETRNGISITYCNTFSRPNSQSIDTEIPNIKADRNLIPKFLFFFRLWFGCNALFSLLFIKEIVTQVNTGTVNNPHQLEIAGKSSLASK